MKNTIKTATTRAKLNARFHQLVALNKCDADEKAMIVSQASNGLYTSTKDLSFDQLLEAIKLLDDIRNTSIKRMRAKAINRAKDLGIVTDSKELGTDWTGLNTFCGKTFNGKKFFMLTFDELRNCITALENWLEGKRKSAVKAASTPTPIQVRKSHFPSPNLN